MLVNSSVSIIPETAVNLINNSLFQHSTIVSTIILGLGKTLLLNQKERFELFTPSRIKLTLESCKRRSSKYDHSLRKCIKKKQFMKGTFFCIQDNGHEIMNARAWHCSMALVAF
jgi:hypothetical protein